jgi:hypothetical protein
MKNKFAALLLLAIVIMVGTTARADQPSPEVVKAFQRFNDADTTCVIEKIIPFIVPADLGAYQRTMVYVISMAVDEGVSLQVFGNHFGDVDSVADLMNIDSVSFYVGCNNWFMDAMPGVKEANRNMKKKLIGSINKSPDKVYLVYRADMKISGVSVSPVIAMMLRKIGSEWLWSLEGSTDKVADSVWKMLMRNKK